MPACSQKSEVAKDLSARSQKSEVIPFIFNNKRLRWLREAGKAGEAEGAGQRACPHVAGEEEFFVSLSLLFKLVSEVTKGYARM